MHNSLKLFACVLVLAPILSTRAHAGEAKVFEPASKLYTVMMPAGEHLTDHQYIKVDKQTIAVEAYQTKTEDGTRYLGAYVGMPVTLMRQIPRDERYDTMCEWIVKGMKGEVTEKKEINQDGVPGKQFDVKVDDGFARLQVYNLRGYLLYCTVHAKDKESLDRKEVQACFDSFKLSDKFKEDYDKLEGKKPAPAALPPGVASPANRPPTTPPPTTPPPATVPPTAGQGTPAPTAGQSTPAPAAGQGTPAPKPAPADPVRRPTTVRPVRGDAPLPEGAAKTDLLGGKGGSPYTLVPANAGPVLGFRYVIGSWGRTKPLRKLEPLYDSSAEKEANVVLARQGYAVGGMNVAQDQTNILAVQVIFMRYKDGKLDPKDSYKSDWISDSTGKNVVQLAGDGKLVIGTFGRQGMNLDAFGLIIQSGGKAP